MDNKFLRASNTDIELLKAAATVKTPRNQPKVARYQGNFTQNNEKTNITENLILSNLLNIRSRIC